ncbi:hypothetical protein NQ317_002540 [Molorchus minor]|uniref:Uncharacterized protein n=1 Tax=Molorchus minor TaxID=1323400 RepID=A0ABQ9JDL5_9CUCU|nr:hypothetical protein NQ317_002540 [Molorchus minor]
MKALANYLPKNIFKLSCQSCDIGQALYANTWYEQPQKIKKMLIVMKMRCNRSLGLEIGPFAIMSLNIFIGILKATYSYMMLVYG